MGTAEITYFSPSDLSYPMFEALGTKISLIQLTLTSVILEAPINRNCAVATGKSVVPDEATPSLISGALALIDFHEVIPDNNLPSETTSCTSLVMPKPPIVRSKKLARPRLNLNRKILLQ